MGACWVYFGVKFQHLLIPQCSNFNDLSLPRKYSVFLFKIRTLPYGLFARVEVMWP
jgi:hypothetical protein